NLNNDSGCSGNAYGNYTDLTPADLAPGETYTINISTSSFYPDENSVAAWIDYNQNGTFEEDERIGSTEFDGMGDGTVDFEFTVPEEMEADEYRMRVRLIYSGYEIPDPCIDEYYGETEDYTIEIINLDECEGPVSAGNVIENAIIVCANTPFTLQ